MILSTVTGENAYAFRELSPGGELEEEDLEGCFAIGALWEEEDGGKTEGKKDGTQRIPAGLIIFEAEYTELGGFHSAEPELHLIWLYVHEAYRGRGIGRCLMRKALSLAISAGLKGINCSLYIGEREGNEEIKGFLEHYNFRFTRSERLDFSFQLKDFAEHEDINAKPEKGYSVVSISKVSKERIDEFFGKLGLDTDEGRLRPGEVSYLETVVSSAILKGRSVQGVFLADLDDYYNGSRILDNVFLRVLPGLDPRNILAMIMFSLRSSLAIYGGELTMHVASEYPPSIRLVKYFVKDAPSRQMEYGVYNIDKDKVQEILKTRER
ncbi:MAG: GNAT family N-acetyltransferase [Lachnospiraceae bacterium]|nr:GNAT family N-acetyltransferase [Lachnospiraceae bacterium]